MYQKTSISISFVEFHFDLKFGSTILIFLPKICKKKQEKIAFFSVSWSVLGEWNYKIQPFFKKISKINNILAHQYKKLWIRGFLARNFNFFLKVMFVEISLFFIQYVHSKKYKVFTTPCRFKTTLWKSLIF